MLKITIKTTLKNLSRLQNLVIKDKNIGNIKEKFFKAKLINIISKELKEVNELSKESNELMKQHNEEKNTLLLKHIELNEDGEMYHNVLPDGRVVYKVKQLPDLSVAESQALLEKGIADLEEKYSKEHKQFDINKKELDDINNKEMNIELYSVTIDELSDDNNGDLIIVLDDMGLLLDS